MVFQHDSLLPKTKNLTRGQYKEQNPRIRSQNHGQPLRHFANGRPREGYLQKANERAIARQGFHQRGRETLASLVVHPRKRGLRQGHGQSGEASSLWPLSQRPESERVVQERLRHDQNRGELEKELKNNEHADRTNTGAGTSESSA